MKNVQSVTSHAFGPYLPLSQTVIPSRPLPLERDVLYGRSLSSLCRPTTNAAEMSAYSIFMFLWRLQTQSFKF